MVHRQHEDVMAYRFTLATSTESEFIAREMSHKERQLLWLDKEYPDPFSRIDISMPLQ
ncbi:predicted protein [Sclerotinia sclerotiorum 1980 UF-70]|uniref:Uncharacterized protein n=2 Tax=Sclerotinia sclerotiorum (strain ATCC 18683 / 1980 / Ss-1) TaxID=665079 RepID=A7EFI7_SCLS1|nr:predicted protein [Sclerotinia sclerotiorum 1980 UF-70]APA07195.1 hypothetical protein sscle_02g019650 [Sclerotinia sclerotiorum 1980 UF-70]EDO01603.1 predicted protein [Sclerotinia sclerotiorum 1980 UF-70]